MRISKTAYATTTLALCLGLGCGDDAKDSANTTDDDKGSDAGDNDSGADKDAGGTADAVLALDPSLSADAAAQDLCRLMPWVVGKLSEKQLPASKVKNNLRDDVEVFIDDKPPICLDDADSMKDLCIEKPTEAETFGYLYRAAGALPDADVEQVWCKSDNFADLALIKGAEKAARGECAALQGLVVTWAEAQLGAKTTRSLKYEAGASLTGSAWARGLVTTSEAGDVLNVVGPELYAPTKATYLAEGGQPIAILEDNFFGNHYCKVLSPARVLAWLQGK